MWKDCLHYVCKECGDECGVLCPTCRGGAKKPSRDLDIRYPVEKVYGRDPPKDAEGRTWAQVRMKDVETRLHWLADTKRFINHADTKTAKADPDWLANRHVYTLRDCKRHGPFVMRQDMQSGCFRCAQGDRCADSVETEPDMVCKRKRNSKHPVINEWLGNVSDDDDDDYSDLKSFISEDVYEEFTDEKQEHDTLFRRNADDWDACEWEAYLIQHCPTEQWKKSQARIFKRKRE